MNHLVSYKTIFRKTLCNNLNNTIGISDAVEPIEAKINTKPTLESLPNAEQVVLGDDNYSIPCLYDNGAKLMTSRYENDKEYVFSFTKESGKWTNKKRETELSISGENYNYVEFVNTQFLVKGGVSYSRGTNECGFELFENKSGLFSLLGQLKIAAFNNYEDYSDATFTDDLKVMILAIETDFTQGGMDLYFTTRKEDGTYGFLQNLGKVINSAADEASPQLLSDQKTLLFSSTGFSGFGGYDIFVSFRLDDTWKN